MIIRSFWLRPLLCAAVGLAALLSIAPAQSQQPSAAAPCGGTERCQIEGGYYLAAPPPGWDGVSKLPVIVYYHGWNASPEGAFRNRAMVNGAHRRGAMFVAPFARTGYWRQIGAGRAEGGRDEAAYARALMADLKRRWPIDETKVLASGFSRGGSMVWNLACYTGELFTAYAPIAGGFWHSTPAACPSGPARIRHIHGMADRVVAFDTVGVYNSMPIPEGMALWRRINGCEGRPDAERRDGRLTCRRWSACRSGKTVELCLHPRGHSIPAEWVASGFDWMVGLERGARGAAQ